MTDWELLSKYRGGSEPAFAELVGRHVDWVYSAALRRVRDPHTAADVTQATFIALSQAGKFREGAVMSAWLFQVMRFASAKALRSESRRKKHEAAAGQMPRPADDEPTWDDLAPLLEDAVANLGRKDRSAVLLRFYERKSFADVGGSLGISEEGARKRVARAVEKLRGYFARQGYPAAMTSLATTLAAHTVASAPSNLASAGLSSAQPTVQLAHSALHTLRRTRFLRGAMLAGGGLLVIASTTICLALRPATTRAQPEPATRPTTISFVDVINGIMKAQTSFSNLYIKDFKTTVDEKPVDAKDWKATPIKYLGSAWFDASAEGKARINFTDTIETWEEKPGKWSWLHGVYDRTWDGSTGYEIRGWDSPPGKRPTNFETMRREDRASTIYPEMRIRTGVGFTMQYWVMDEESSYPKKPRPDFSEFFEKELNSNHPPEISLQMVNGFDAVRLKWKWPSVAQEFWFDASRGFALVKRETVLQINNEAKKETFDVLELKEAAPGVWFPLRATMVVRDDEPYITKPGGYERYNFTAADAVANDPKFDPAIFKAKLPPGYPHGGTAKP